MQGSDRHGAVVVGGYVTGLSTVRALSSLGIPIAVVSTTPSDMAQYSRWASEHHELLQFSKQPESLLELLEKQCQKWKGWVVLSSYDDAIAIMSQNRERLERWYRFITPPWEVARNLLQKDLTYKAAKEVGIDIPRLYGDATPETGARDDIEFPVLVKPIESRPFFVHFGKKLFVARNRAELLSRIQELQTSGLRAQIMDLVPGPDSQFYNYTAYIDKSGHVAADMTMRKLRKSPPFFGVVRVAETIKADELREPTIELLRRVGWRGMASAEYKLDPRDGRYRLMEINARPFLIQGLALRAGVNYPLLAWRESVYGENVRAAYNGWNGVWINCLDDLYYGAFFRKTEGLTLQQYLAPYRRPKTYSVWSAADPKPFLAQCYQAAGRGAMAALSSHDRSARRSRVQSMRTGSNKPG